MTLDQLVRATGVVGHRISFDKLGNQFIGWLETGDKTTSLVLADNCDEAIDKLALRLAGWLRETKPDRYEQALKILCLAPPGCSIWERLRHPQWNEGERSVPTAETEDRCERPSFGDQESSEVCAETRPCPHHEPNGRRDYTGDVSESTTSRW